MTPGGAGGAGVAVITGASRGIGRAVALEAARRGFDVLVGCGRDRDRAGEVAAAVTAAGRRAEVCVADLATPAGVEATAGAARALGPVSLLVNNAGVTNSGPSPSWTWTAGRRPWPST